MVSWWNTEAGYVDPKTCRYLVDSSCDGGERWLLIGGAMDPPAHVNASKKNGVKGSGPFLRGITKDINSMQEKLVASTSNQLDDFLLDMKITREVAIKKISSFLMQCEGKTETPVIYYTGHGQCGTGDWCFADGSLSFQDVKTMCPEKGKWPYLYIDCCFSGHWANHARNEGGPKVLAACPYFMTALDSEDGAGSDFTKWIIGKNTKPTRPIVYSGFSAADRPLPLPPRRMYPYCKRLEGELFGNRIVMAQEFDQKSNECTVVFGAVPGYPRKSSCVSIQSSELSTIQYYQTQWDSGYRIMHLSCGRENFGVVMMKDFAKRQSVFQNNECYLQRCAERNWAAGFKITSVCPCLDHDTPWAVVFSQCVDHYLFGDYEKDLSKLQRWSTWKTLSDLVKEINRGYEDGYIVTSIAHRKGHYIKGFDSWFSRPEDVVDYFVVMTQSPKNQKLYFGYRDGSCNACMKKAWDEGKDITAMFKDPISEKWVVVGTSGINAKNVGYTSSEF